MLRASEIRILVVDDEPLTIKAVAANFEVFGFQVDKCESVDVARQILNESEVNIVLLDWHMPKKGGEKLLNEIRARHWAKPSVFPMVEDLSVHVEKILALGADGLLLKPFEAAATRDLIQQSCLGLKQMWMTPYRKEPKATVQESITSLDDENGKVNFGRGGFFLASAPSALKVDDTVSFEISVKDGVSPLSGIGVVRWKREKGAKEAEGLGVEIKYLEDGMREALLDWLEKNTPIPFIPAGI